MPCLLSAGRLISHADMAFFRIHRIPPTRSSHCLHMMTEGGVPCVDFYEKSWKSTQLPKYWLRPPTSIPKRRLVAPMKSPVPKMLPLSVFLKRVRWVRYHLKRIVPVTSYVGSLPLTRQQQLEWSLLDTFDWLTPAYDHPQTSKSVRHFFARAGTPTVESLKARHIAGRGEKA
jgi:hypothetical protein